MIPEKRTARARTAPAVQTSSPPSASVVTECRTDSPVQLATAIDELLRSWPDAGTRILDAYRAAGHSPTVDEIRAACSLLEQAYGAGNVVDLGEQRRARRESVRA